MIGLQLPMLQAGAAAGVTPGPANWTDLVGSIFGQTNSQTISVGEATLFRIELSSVSASVGAVGIIEVIVNSASIAFDTIADGLTLDFTINEGDVVYFAGSGSGELDWEVDAVATIKYGAPSFGSTLDTFNINLGS